MSSSEVSKGSVWGIAAVLVGAVAVGGYWFLGRDGDDATSAALRATENTDTNSALEATDSEDTADETSDDGTKADAADVAETRLDEVRIEEGGLAVIAGRTTPVTDVIVRADGDEVARAKSDGSGSFAIVTVLSPSEAARVLTVAPIGADGVEGDIGDELILAPVAVPETATTSIAQSTDAVTPKPETGASQEPKEETVVAAADVSPQVPTVDANARDVTESSLDESPVSPQTPNISNTPTQLALGTDADASPDTTGVSEVSSAEDLDVQDRVTALDADALATEGGATQGTPSSDSLQAAALAPDQLDLGTDADTAPDTTGVTALNSSQDLDVQDRIATLDVDALATEGTATDVTPSKEVPQPKAEAPAAPPRPQSFAILRADKDGVEVVQPASPTPQVQSQVALDAISYSVEGDVQLTGRAQDSADQVQVYLNNRPIAQLDVDNEGGWRGPLPDVDTGIYTLRIDELNEQGEVTSRVETPFKREDPEVLKEATENTDGAVTAITVQKGATLWAIARERYGEGTLFVRVFEANKDSIRDPNLIYPGQIFNLPDD